jgi:hypothetical protein
MRIYPQGPTRTMESCTRAAPCSSRGHSLVCGPRPCRWHAFAVASASPGTYIYPCCDSWFAVAPRRWAAAASSCLKGPCPCTAALVGCAAWLRLRCHVGACACGLRLRGGGRVQLPQGLCCMLVRRGGTWWRRRNGLRTPRWPDAPAGARETGGGVRQRGHHARRRPAGCGGGAGGGCGPGER